jgi:hypothetical protein
VGPRRLALLCLLLLPSPAAAAAVDYLYVAPGTGGASGGHVAIRLDDRVYHFRHEPSGALRLVRSTYPYFRWAYSVLGNRPIRVARIRVDDATRERLRAEFNRRYLAERSWFTILASLDDDLALARAPRTGTDGPSPLPLPGTGFFRAGERSPALVRLRARVAAALGPSFIADRTAALRAAIAGLAPDAGGSLPASLAPDAPPPSHDGAAERWRDAVLELVALRILDRARGLDPAALAGDGFPLAPGERERLVVFGDALTARLARLPTSQRRDWGFPLLLGMARLATLERSVRTGRLTVLDASPDRTPTIAVERSGDGAAFLAELEDEARAGLVAARAAALGRPDFDEGAWSRLEDAANRFAEVARGRARGDRIRVHADLLLPAHAATDVAVPLPVRAADPAAAAAARDRWAAALDAAFGYDLFSRNCVTELLATVEAALGRDGETAALGGRLDPHGTGVFVPALSFRAVLRTWRVAASGVVPSHRGASLERMYAAGGGLGTYLRESNTVTSTIYRRTDDDPLFLFFTDDVLAPRPLYGAANLAAGVAETLWGVVESPFDGGRRLRAGLTGAAFSLPELVFVSLRKGTMRYARGAAPGEPVRLRPPGG